MPPPSTIRLPGPRLADFRSLPGLAGFAMDLFTQLFGSLLAFVYHCFDRIVIYGYLSGLSRPERVVNFFHQVVGVPVVSREILSLRTQSSHPDRMGRKGRAQGRLCPAVATPHGAGG